jgi:protein TonB
MFGGFDPSGDPDRSFFERRRWQSLLAAILLVGGSLAQAFWLASREEPVVEEEEIVDAEIQNFEMEEEPEPEPEEEPPPPEPPSSDPKPKKSKPTPQPKIENVDQADQNPEEGDVDTQGPGEGGSGGGNDQRSTGDGGKKPAEPEKQPEPEKKPKPKPKKVEIDDSKPIERPESATVPKKIGGDPIAYPEDLRKRNVTGKIKVKLTIYKDGSVKGAKVLAKQNSVDPAEDPELAELAHKLFLKAVQKALPTWKYEPSKYEGKPITVYLTITIPFDLD